MAKYRVALLEDGNLEWAYRREGADSWKPAEFESVNKAETWLRNQVHAGKITSFMVFVVSVVKEFRIDVDKTYSLRDGIGADEER